MITIDHNAIKYPHYWSMEVCCSKLPKEETQRNELKRASAPDGTLWKGKFYCMWIVPVFFKDISQANEPFHIPDVTVTLKKSYDKVLFPFWFYPKHNSTSAPNVFLGKVYP